jgi:hypothetical protein
MNGKKITGKRTTPKMTADQRLEKWIRDTCPYCGGKSIKTETAKGMHYQCQDEACLAENYFSNQRHLDYIRANGGD